MRISLKDEVKVVKRKVYTILDMVGDIGGLYDGLIIITSFILTLYNTSAFDSALVANIFKF